MQDDKELSFDEIFSLLYKPIHAYATAQCKGNEYDGDEIASLTFQHLYKKWDTLTSHTEKGLKQWLYRAAKYNVQTYLREQAKLPLSVDIEEYAQSNPEFYQKYVANDPETVLDIENCNRIIHIVKSTLTEQEYKLLQYIAFCKYTYDQAATLLDTTPNNIGVQMYRIRQKLKKRLEKDMS